MKISMSSGDPGGQSARGTRERTLAASAALLGLSLVLPSGAVLAQDDTAAQANNPLAHFTALNIQDYYIGELTAPEDKSANQFWMRFATPFSLGDSGWLLRASLPINSYPTSSTLGTRTGIGDLNLFAAYMIDVGNPAISFGIGPQLTIPSGSSAGLSSEKYSAGLVNVLFNASSPKFQYGYLLSWQGDIGGPGDEGVSIGAFQPFAFYQLGQGYYLRAAPIWAYNFENDSYSMPLGVGIGKVFKGKKMVSNLFIEPQWSVADKGAFQPDWQVFVGYNMQFSN